MVLGQVANCKTNNAAEVAHFLGLEDVMEAKLEAPEDHGRDQAHDGIEGESLSVVGDAARPEAEDVALVEDVLDHKPDACAHDDRGQDVEGAAVGTDDKILSANVCCSCD